MEFAQEDSPEDITADRNAAKKVRAEPAEAKDPRFQRIAKVVAAIDG